MTAFSGLGLGLSLVFGFLLLALMAELYYLLWWKKKRITDSTEEMEPHEYGFFANELFRFHFAFWKKSKRAKRKPGPDSSSNGNGDDLESAKGAGSDQEYQTVESELMRLHNLAGPPRFLFTIKEETKEDLESEDGRSRKGSRTRSLSDLILTPLASPPVKSPAAATVMKNNPLFESTAEAELMRLRSSPPPKFKFLRDAEEKLYRRLAEEAERKKGERAERVFAFVVGDDGGVNLPVCPSGSTQVLPLPSSPTAFSVQKPR